MSKFLIYGGCPFEHEEISEIEIVERNMFGNNIGNELFFNAVVRSLSDKPEQEFFRLSKHSDCINDFDYIVMPQANSLRAGCANEFKWLYNFLCDTKKPVVVIGIGGDSGNDFIHSIDKETKESSALYLRLVLEHSQSIGVRGSLTKNFCVNDLGLHPDRVRVIGCPSVRYHGKLPPPPPPLQNIFKRLKNSSLSYTVHV